MVSDRLTWEKQPRVENVYVDKNTLVLKPLEATEVSQDLQVRLRDASRKLNLMASAVVEVRGGDPLALLERDTDVWGVHPPVSARRQVHQLRRLLGR